MGDNDEDKTEVISFSQNTGEKDISELSVTTNTDTEKTIVTNIDEEPTVVVTEEDEKTAVNLDLGSAGLDLSDPITQDRCDPRKVRSVLGTFKVYVLRKGKTEEFVYEGLRNKDYSESEIRAGFEQYCEIRDSIPPTILDKIKTLWSKLTNLLNKKD